MSAEERDVSVRACRLHVRRWGSEAAPLVIAVPGLTGSSARFGFLGERIARDGMQLVAIDPRGRGRSETTPSGTYGWENHARDVLALADALGRETFAMIGHSMGGSVAMKTAELDAARLRGVVLLDVAGRVDRGGGAVIASEIERRRDTYDSVEDYLDAVRTDGFIEPWNEH